jgi:hypothetical protein
LVKELNSLGLDIVPLEKTEVEIPDEVRSKAEELIAAASDDPALLGDDDATDDATDDVSDDAGDDDQRPEAP